MKNVRGSSKSHLLVLKTDFLHLDLNTLLAGMNASKVFFFAIIDNSDRGC